MSLVSSIVGWAGSTIGAIGNALQTTDIYNSKVSAANTAAESAQREVDAQILADQEQITYLGSKKTATKSAYTANSGALSSQKNSTIGQMNATAGMNGMQNSGSIASVIGDQTSEFDQKLQSMADAYNLDILGIDTQVNQTTRDIASSQQQKILIEQARQNDVSQAKKDADASVWTNISSALSGSAAQSGGMIDYAAQMAALTKSNKGKT